MEKLWYKAIDGKRIKVVPTEIAEWMNEQVLAVWFMDDGKTDWMNRPSKSKNANPISTFCTDSFSIEDVENLQRILNNNFDIKSKRDVWRNRIVLSTDSTLELHKLLQSEIHETIEYKIDKITYLNK